MIKKLFFTLFLVFILLLPLSAQARLGNFTQRGTASQDMKDEGFTAAHPSLPLNSNVKVTNTVNGKEVEVKITNRIGVSSNRIIDLSAAAFNALELKRGDVVVVSVNAPPPRAQTPENSGPTVEISRTPAQPQTAASQQAASPAVLSGNSAASQNTAPEQAGSANSGRGTAQNDGNFPFPIPSSRSNDSEFLAWLMTMSMEARESRDVREEREIRQAREEREIRQAREERIAREEREIREAREARLVREEREAREAREARLAREEREAREAIQARETKDTKKNLNSNMPLNEDAKLKPVVELVQVLPSPVKVEDIKIVPGLPSRNSNNLFRLQVGAYSVKNKAAKIAEFIQNAGFDVELETSGSIYRILVTGIAAPDVYSVSLKLGTLGFGQIWIKE
jgi:flagellar biosynthesis GTPase FlhF